VYSMLSPHVLVCTSPAVQCAESQGAYDWYGDYVSLAVKSGNVPVLTILLEGGYELKWQQAQVRLGLGNDCRR